MEEKLGQPKFTADRLNGFSDGVLAIVVTILVLGIDIPTDHDFSDAGLESFFHKLESSLLAYVISFALGISYWVQHYFMFHFVKYTSSKLIFLNAFFLLSITLLPFVSKVKTLYEFDFHAVLIYSIVQFFISGSMLMLWRYVVNNDELLGEPISALVVRNFTFLLLAMPIVCVLTVVISIFSVYIGTLLFFIIPLINILFYANRKVYL
jgi:uncharacterized membrane protein